MTTKSDEEYEPDASQAWMPAVEGMDEPADEQSTSDAQPWQWLRPDDSDTDADGRTGLLSTYVEWHALVIGLAVGAMAARTGEFSTIAAIVGAGAAGSRAQAGLPDEYVDQAKAELPYFVFGVGVAFVLLNSRLLAGFGVGV